MLRKVFKLIIFFLFIFSGFFLWVGRKRVSPYLKWGELDSKHPQFDSRPGVLIIFNSGGWGNTAFEEAEDFAKVIRGINVTINKLGWRTAILSYGRTMGTFLGRMSGVKEILNSFKSQSDGLAKQVKIFLGHNPQSRVLITGLSLGANFVNETMKKIGPNPRVLAIKAGAPFWEGNLKSKNILELTNRKDFLVTGDHKNLIKTVVKGLARWTVAKVKRHKLSFSRAVRVPGHRYDWRSPHIRKQITSFLEANLMSSK